MGILGLQWCSRIHIGNDLDGLTLLSPQFFWHLPSPLLRIQYVCISRFSRLNSQRTLLTEELAGQTMMGELCPPGYENMFFGLFGLSNRASSIIGPNVIQEIINKSNGNNWMGFPFLFALAFVASLVIWFGIDVERGQSDAVAFALRRRKVVTSRSPIVLQTEGTEPAGDSGTN